MTKVDGRIALLIGNGESIKEAITKIHDKQSAVSLSQVEVDSDGGGTAEEATIRSACAYLDNFAGLTGSVKKNFKTMQLREYSVTFGMLHMNYHENLEVKQPGLVLFNKYLKKNLDAHDTKWRRKRSDPTATRWRKLVEAENMISDKVLEISYYTGDAHEEGAPFLNGDKFQLGTTVTLYNPTQVDVTLDEWKHWKTWKKESFLKRSHALIDTGTQREALKSIYTQLLLERIESIRTTRTTENWEDDFDRTPDYIEIKGQKYTEKYMKVK